MKKQFFLLFMPVLVILSEHSYANNNEKYEALLKNNIKANGPGVSVIVHQSGKTLFSSAHGMANIELGVPLSTQHVFRVGSIAE